LASVVAAAESEPTTWTAIAGLKELERQASDVSLITPYAQIDVSRGEKVILVVENCTGSALSTGYLDRIYKIGSGFTGFIL
jgi:hypothetical protein